MTVRISEHKMHISELNNREKRVQVFLPYDYYHSEKSYPVIYMGDGQNLVEPSPLSGYSWDVQNTLDDMQREGLIDGIIIVGIDSDPTDRILEYSFDFSKKVKKVIQHKLHLDHTTPQGEVYASFVANEVKPFIDQMYRTLSDRENTYIAGSSCGANIAFYIGVKYKHIFSGIGAFSPALWMVKHHLIPFINDAEFDIELRIYLDMGTKEGFFGKLTFIKDLNHLSEVFLSKGVSSKNICKMIDKGALHTELFWQSRFREFIQFMFQKSR